MTLFFVEIFRNATLFGIILNAYGIHGLTSLPANDDFATQVRQLQKEVSDLRVQFQTQEKKYSALLSTVISQISSSRHALDTVKAEVDSLKLDHLETKAELKNATDDINILKGSVLQNEISVNSLQSNFTVNAISVSREAKMSKSELNVMKSNVSELLLYHRQTVVKLSSLENNIRQDTQFLAVVNSTLEKLQNRTGDDSTIVFAAESTRGPKVRAGDAVPFPVIHSNDLGVFSATSGIFTAPVPGVYMFWTNVVWMSASSAGVYIKTPRYTIHGNDEPHYQSVAKFQRRLVGVNNVKRKHSLSVGTVVYLQQGETVMILSSQTLAEVVHGSFGGSLIKKT